MNNVSLIGFDNKIDEFTGKGFAYIMFGILNLGMFELFIFLPVVLIGFALPIVCVVLIFLIYMKVNRIESLLQEREHSSDSKLV